jgi:hypothetical protein
MTDFVLKFDNNVVEHLGLKLYQNKPTRVIAEIVSNSWDADAREVLVNLGMQEVDPNNRWIAVIDDGHGMNREDLRDSFLVIGRHKAVPRQGMAGRRPIMGRKGIGKLAPFGIAKVVDVVTVGVNAKSTREVTWLRLNLDDVLKHGASGAYTPDEIFTGASLSDIPLSRDTTGQVKIWVDHVSRESNTKQLGTLILMQKTSLRKVITEEQLIESLGRRFTVTLRDSFHVHVNTRKVEQSIALPEFEFRIPENGYEAIDIGGKDVRFWVGFVKQADWPQDQAGIGVYAHGKIAQDRPFTFGAKGNEIWTRYMYGVIEADWLDELAEDLISTDRTTVNWDADDARPLFDWGQKKVGEWTRKFSQWRKEQDKKENEKLLVEELEQKHIPRVTGPEQDQIVQLLSQITPRMGKDEQAKKELLRAVSEAWVQKPMQKLVKDLWKELGETGRVAPEAFTHIVTKLSAHGVPESLNLAIVFAQRAFALTKLHEYVHTGNEPNLQLLVERFPWIIEPDAAVLTANQPLKSVIEKAEAEGLIPTGRRTAVAGTSNKNRPDFVFLSSPEERDILVVELKSPQETLTIANRKQLEDYMSFLEEHYPNSRISGVLVGKNPGKLVAKYGDSRIVEWTEVLRLSRARNLELLAAMLLQASGASGDSRIETAVKLGGQEAKEMLSRLSVHHDDLKRLMKEFESNGTGSKPAAVADT